MNLEAGAALASGALEPLAKSGEAVKAGPIGLGVILLLCIACYFLFKSMSKHMRNVRENFPSDEPSSADPSSALPTSTTADTGRQAETSTAQPPPATE